MAPSDCRLSRARSGSGQARQIVAMAHRKIPAYLRAVETPAPQTRVRAEDFSPVTWQATLFAQSNPSLLVFVDFERATEF